MHVQLALDAGHHDRTSSHEHGNMTNVLIKQCAERLPLQPNRCCSSADCSTSGRQPASSWRGGCTFEPRLRPPRQRSGRSSAVLVSSGPGVHVAEKWWRKDVPDNLVSVDSLDVFLSQLAGASDKLVVVDFYAKWCHSCRALFPKFCQLCRANPEVIFVKVDWDDNKDVCKALGVKLLPYFHFYRGAEGRVAAFTASISKLQRLRDAIEEHKCSSYRPPAVTGQSLAVRTLLTSIEEGNISAEDLGHGFLGQEHVQAVMAALAQQRTGNGSNGSHGHMPVPSAGKAVQ